MKIIGITGGVGAGKSCILDYIKANYNCYIILADDLAKDLCLKGQCCYKPLIDLLGETVISADGEIDRRVMADLIFKKPELRELVNSIIHPAVLNFILEKIDQLRTLGNVDYFFIEAALLIECGYKKVVDELWYIYASEDVRRIRLRESRGYSDEKIDNIFNSQLSESEFRKNADFVIDNSGSVDDSFQMIRERMRE